MRPASFDITGNLDAHLLMILLIASYCYVLSYCNVCFAPLEVANVFFPFADGVFIYLRDV